MKLGDLSNSAPVRTLVLLALYATALAGSLWLAYELRFDFNVPADIDPVNFQSQRIVVLLWLVPLKLILLAALRQFAPLLSYFSVPDLSRLSYALGLSSVLLWGIRVQAGLIYGPPKGVILVDAVLSLMLLAAARLSFRLLREQLTANENPSQRRARRVAVIGAGDVGASLVRELSVKRGLGLTPIAFFDDDRSKWHSRVHNIPVVGAPEELLDQRLNLQLEEAIIAMPGASARRIGEIIRVLQKAHLKFATVPSMDQLATGQIKVSQLRNVEIQDLLGREPVELETDDIRQLLADRVVMVTGAGGSIGGELCRQIAAFNPKRLLLVEQSEVQIFLIEQELIGLGHGGVILPLVADILDAPRMRQIFARFQPEVIFHAAAHKHVPMMENQPSEAIKNNTLGTAQLADLAMEYGVGWFVMISTDKAINPTNVMGATKRLAEIFVQALHAADANHTKFMAVRFGNVLGSSGSVIPIFKRQIAEGGPVKVTHPEVTRYFMTIPEAVGLVLQSAAQGQGGEIFVLDMGKPIKIVDLARQMIELSGLKPDEDIQIEFVGLRPGEKLFEEINHKLENITPTSHPKILRFVSQPRDVDEVRETLKQLSCRLHDTEPNQLKTLLKEAVPEYQPYLT